MSKAPNTRTQRGFVSWHILVVLAVIAGVLLFVQRRRSAGEVELATGPANAAQKEFIEASAGRPDLLLFYKDLTPAGRIKLAENLGKQATPAAAKMATTLLATFDEEARRALTDALARIAQEKPDLVAAELGRSGSFELQGIYSALARAFPKSIYAATMALADPGRRANAIRFLVEGAQDPRQSAAWKAACAHMVTPLIDAEDAGVRTAAAEVSGKLRLREAVHPLLLNLDNARGEEHVALLAALADIGAAGAERALLAEVGDKKAPPARLLAGLGRIASDASLHKLLDFWDEASVETRPHVFTALVLAGDRGLAFARDPELKLQIAAQLDTKESTRVIRTALADPILAALAIQAARNREKLVEDLLPTSTRANDPLTAIRLDALATTKRGRAVLAKLQSHPEIGGLAQRALELAKP